MTSDAATVREALEFGRDCGSRSGEGKIMRDALAALDRLVAVPPSPSSAVWLGVEAKLDECVARAEAAEASLDKAVRDLRDQMEARERAEAERDECRKAFKIGHSTLMRMQARAEKAEAERDELAHGVTGWAEVMSERRRTASALARVAELEATQIDVSRRIDAPSTYSDSQKSMPTCKHTPCPSGYVAWHMWAEKKSVTHDQHRCPVCDGWAIWKRKKGETP